MGKLGALTDLTSAGAGTLPAPDFASFAATGWQGCQLVVQDPNNFWISQCGQQWANNWNNGRCNVL
jgi:hypothetical protein